MENFDAWYRTVDLSQNPTYEQYRSYVHTAVRQRLRQQNSKQVNSYLMSSASERKIQNAYYEDVQYWSNNLAWRNFKNKFSITGVTNSIILRLEWEFK